MKAIDFFRRVQQNAEGRGNSIKATLHGSGNEWSMRLYYNNGMVYMKTINFAQPVRKQKAQGALLTELMIEAAASGIFFTDKLNKETAHLRPEHLPPYPSRYHADLDIHLI